MKDNIVFVNISMTYTSQNYRVHPNFRLTDGGELAGNSAGGSNLNSDACKYTLVSINVYSNIR